MVQKTGSVLQLSLFGPCFDTETVTDVGRKESESTKFLRLEGVGKGWSVRGTVVPVRNKKSGLRPGVH